MKMIASTKNIYIIKIKYVYIVMYMKLNIYTSYLPYFPVVGVDAGPAPALFSAVTLNSYS